MKTFLHLLRRELIDHRMVFVAALLAGFLPYLLALPAASSGYEAADLRADFARGAMIAFFGVAPIVLGLRFDAGSLALEVGETWHFPHGISPDAYDAEAWWHEALPLLDAGLPFEVLSGSSQVTSLAGGYGVLVAERADTPPHIGHRFRIVDRSGKEVGSFAAEPGGYPAGEIRPGLLLVGLQAKSNLVDYFLGSSVANRFLIPEPLETLVVEVPSGRIVKKLDGLRPRKFAPASDRVWLENDRGEPFDLASADAEPQRIFPFRPRDR